MQLPRARSRSGASLSSASLAEQLLSSDWDIQSITPCSPVPPPQTDSDRHKMQRKAIVQQMQGAGVLAGGAAVVEFGAGDGQLGQAVRDASGGGIRCILIDQRPVPTPVEEQGERQTVRLCSEIGDLQRADLQQVVHGCASVVVLSNHLCGQAMDVAVRHALAAWPREQTPATPAGASHLAGIFAVTCCHHHCSWGTFLGQETFRRWGLSKQEFERMRRWSRMAPRRQKAAGSRSRVLAESSRLGLSPAECERLGQRCRQLMDTARGVFLQQSAGYEVQLLNHVPTAATADNCMIRAVLPRSSARPSPWMVFKSILRAKAGSERAGRSAHSEAHELAADGVAPQQQLLGPLADGLRIRGLGSS